MRFDMSSLKGFIRIIRPLNSIMTGLGILVGIVISGRTELLSLGWNLVYIFLTGFTLAGASMAINDYFDRNIDASNEPQRPIPSGIVKPIEAIALSLLLSMVGLLAAWLTCKTCFWMALFAWMVMMLYSAWGKQTGFPGNLMVSLCISLPFLYGGVLADNVYSALLFSVMAFLSNSGREITKGIVDVEGDEAADINTIAVSHGASFAAKFASLFYLLAVFVSVSPLYLGIVSIWYLPFVALTDIILLYGSYMIIKKPSRNNCRNTKNMVLYGMLSGLIGFAAGTII